MTILKQKLLRHLLAIRGGAALHIGALGKATYQIIHKELGEFSFPLNTMQANALISVAHPAPFGKGHETIVDESVRCTWEIDAKDLTLSDKKLNNSLTKLLKATANTLNIPVGIEAKPYKLLIYEKGGFFLAHQDSEKLRGMFGTLLIGLPSTHEGGELVIEREEGLSETIDFSANNAADFPAVAFLADQEHEIKPVTAGYRVVLVYNLLYANGVRPERMDNDAETTKLAETLRLLSPKEPLMLALEHQYTETNFSSAQLKQHDLPRVQILRRAAAEAGLEMRVGLIHAGGSYGWANAHEFGHDYGYKRSRSGREPKNFQEIEYDDEYDSHLYMNDWLPEDGSNLGMLHIKKGDLLTGPNYQKDEPVEWSAEGYQGNWGMTVEFTYCYAGVVLWQAEYAEKLLSNLPLSGRVDWLKGMCEKLKEKSVEYNDRRQIVALLESIRTEMSENKYVNIDFSALVSIFERLDSSELDFQNWETILFDFFGQFPAEFWKKASDLFGENSISIMLGRIGNESPASVYYRRSKKILPLISALIKLAESEKPNHREIAALHYEQLPNYLEKHIKNHKFETDILQELLKGDLTFNSNKEIRENIANQILKRIPEDRKYLHDNLTTALFTTKNRAELYEYLLNKTLIILRQITTDEPQPYKDFARPLPKDGLDKIVPGIEKFMKNSEDTVFRYKAIQAKRGSAENTFSNLNLDLDYTTERTRPSHTLVMTKTNASYFRAVKQYQKDVILLKKMEGLIK